ncbi:MAG: ATP-binding protein [Aerococcus sp.]|nr:ATP-binding protein [Aerococcus sp.]
MKTPRLKVILILIGLFILYPLLLLLASLVAVNTGHHAAVLKWGGVLLLLVLVIGLGISAWGWRAYQRFSLSLANIRQLIHGLDTQHYTTDYLRRGWKSLDETGIALTTLSKNLSTRASQFSLQKRRLNLLIDYLVIGVMLIDESGTVRIVNQSFYDILGINDPLEGEKYVSRLPGYQLVAMIEQSFLKERSLHEEVTLYFPREAILDVNVVYVTADASGGTFDDQVIVLLYDITKIRHLEKVRSDFIANASHELKTPVTAIKGFSETLLDGALEDPNTAKEFVTIIDQETERLESLIRDILDLAKIEQGQAPYTPEPVEVIGAIQASARSVATLAEREAVSLYLPQTKNAIWVATERESLQQILINLLVNAIKYNTDPGHVWVKVATNEAETQAEITVQDDGIGIPSSDLSRIFERFYRVDKTRAKQTGGTGLGLSIVRNLVERIGGTIAVESILNQGTRFTLSLPLLTDETHE